MLVDINLQRDEIGDLIGKISGKNIVGFNRLDKGIYEISHFNMNHCIPEKYKFTTYPRLKNSKFPCDGVCDDYKQILEQCPELLEDDGREFIIALTRIVAADQSPEGGWRWHKWGEYIGDHKPMCEYIYDEKDLINEVYVYEIIEINPSYETIDDEWD